MDFVHHSLEHISTLPTSKHNCEYILFQYDVCYTTTYTTSKNSVQTSPLILLLEINYSSQRRNPHFTPILLCTFTSPYTQEIHSLFLYRSHLVSFLVQIHKKEQNVIWNIYKYIRANVKYANVYKTYRVTSVNRQTDILFAVVYVSNKFWNQSLRKLLKYSSQQILVPTRGSSHFPART